MLIQSLKQHFPARAPEWLMAGVMTTWGAYVCTHPYIFQRPETASIFAGLAQLADAATWGCILLIVGMIRAGALFVNGAYTRTPMIRLIASAVSVVVWLELVSGLIRSDVPNTGIVVYPWFVIADVLSAYRATIDTVVAERSRHDAAAGLR